MVFVVLKTLPEQKNDGNTQFGSWSVSRRNNKLDDERIVKEGKYKNICLTRFVHSSQKVMVASWKAKT
jgi:hypothetical protein